MMPAFTTAPARTPTRLASFALALVVAIGLSACGGGGDDTGSADSGSAGDAAAPPPTDSASSLQESTDANSGSSGSDSSSESAAPTLASQAFINKTLERVNTARASQRVCGTTTMPAQPALTWDTQIEQAALSHSNWMQSNNAFSHEGENNSTPGTRLSDTGYSWRAVAENIAAGYSGIDAAIDGWLASPGHCRNIMSGNVTQFGMALVDGDNSNSYRTYWTMVLARPT